MGVMQWQPIETAPKDGRRVLFYVPDEAGSDYAFQVGRWDYMRADSDEFQWLYDGDRDKPRYCTAHPPSHWMPLPEPPQ